MDLWRYWYLTQEFLRPFALGAYYDGQDFHFEKDLSSSRPGRLYLAISHAALYFQVIRLPATIPANKLAQALNLEASRLLTLLEGREGLVATSAFTPLKEGAYLVSFRERSFFEEILRNLPKTLVVCGVFPAWVALLAWFYQQGPLEDGFYLARTEKAIEGFQWQEGQVVNVLPSSPPALEALLKKQDLPRHEISPKEAPQVLMQGARLVPQLPGHLVAVFDAYPLSVRPKVPKKALLLWFLPALFWGVGLGLEHWEARLASQEKALDKKLKVYQLEASKLEAELKKQKAYADLAKEIKSYTTRPPLLEALAELARLLPPDTWVRKLEFRAPNTLQLWGESANTLEVIKRLEASPLFKEVKVISSVTKNPRTGKENFAIRTILETPSS